MRRGAVGVEEERQVIDPMGAAFVGGSGHLHEGGVEPFDDSDGFVGFGGSGAEVYVTGRKGVEVLG